MSIQNIQFNREHPNSYMDLATRAAECERQGLWDQAMALWSDALKVARRPQNNVWAQCRINYCQIALDRRWKAAA